MTEALDKEIELAHSKLRELDDSLHSVGAQPRFAAKRRISMEDGRGNSDDRYSRRVTVSSDGSGRRVSLGDRNDRFAKRPRIDDDYEDDVDNRPKKTVQSTVVMPSIETKSREEKIEEAKKSENKAVQNRNRRMFSSLLMGTLKSFQKTEKVVNEAEKKQAEKLGEIEKRLDNKKREEKEKTLEERRSLIEKRKEQERELNALTRKKALIQYAEAKQSHYRLLMNGIQTQTKPTLFFLPAKHTVRSLELLKNSQKVIQGLIDLRQKELERDLEKSANEPHDHHEDDHLKSFVAVKDSGVSRSRHGRSRSRSRSRSPSESGDENMEKEAEKEDDGKEPSQQDEVMEEPTELKEECDQPAEVKEEAEA